MWHKYKNQMVRDMVWAISSPPLMMPVNTECHWYTSAWYQNLHNESEVWFRQLDDSSDELEKIINARKDKRLGSYFETLWAYWIENNPNYELIAKNIQIHDMDRTLGELDFIVQNNANGKVYHWELAVKYYLGADNLNDQACWHGLNKKDRLDKKYSQLLNKQSVLHNKNMVRETLKTRGITINGCGVILKGRFYYPYNTHQKSPVNSDISHLKGCWMRFNEFAQQDICSEKRYQALINKGWLASLVQNEGQLLSMIDIVKMIDDRIVRLPMQLYVPTDDSRMFVVPDDWLLRL